MTQTPDITPEEADEARIKELEAKLAEVGEMKRLLAMDKINLRGELAWVEGKLAEVVAAGVRVRNYYEHHGNTDVYAVPDFNAVIAGLKGENDE
jgi:hypothetical protein